MLELKSNNILSSNYNYCPPRLVFCGKTNNMKLEKIQERSPRTLYNDYDSTYEDLHYNMLLSRLKTLLLETFKSLRHTNAECLHDSFNSKMSPYDLRTTHIVQPKRNTTTHGLRSFSYLGSRLWNNLVNDFYLLCHIDYNGFNAFIKYWTGPNLDDSFNYCNTISIYCYLSFIFTCHFTRPESFMYFFLYLCISYCIFCSIPSYCIYSAALYTCCIPLSYTSLLANVVCFT